MSSSAVPALAKRSSMAPPPPPSTNNERPKKRMRLSELSEQPLKILTQEMENQATSLEVDHMILDYLVYQAINTCFAYPNMPRGDKKLSPVERSILQVDEFLLLFQHRYPRYRPDSALRFRQQLLQLVTLVTQRLVRSSVTPPRSSLQALRQHNQDRARSWIGAPSRLPTAGYDTASFDVELPLSAKKLEENRAQLLDSLCAPAEDDAYEDAFFGTSACISLLDTLPLFMRVSASCHVLFDSNSLTSQWMGLAADWMLQACLEQYLICGQDGSDAIDEAFAWGYKDHGTDDATKQSTDDPFDLDHDQGDVQRWEKIRLAALASLFPKECKSGERVWYLYMASITNSAVSIQRNIVDFLKSLAEAIDKPVLAQLETGQLDGMSKEETREFLQQCGLNVANFYT